MQVLDKELKTRDKVGLSRGGSNKQRKHKNRGVKDDRRRILVIFYGLVRESTIFFHVCSTVV